MIEETTLSRLLNRIDFLAEQVEKANFFAEQNGFDKVDDELLKTTVRNGEALDVLAKTVTSQIKNYGHYSFKVKRNALKSVKIAYHYSSLSMTFNASTFLARNDVI